MKQYRVLLSIIILVILYTVALLGVAFLNLDLIHTTPFTILITPLLLFASHTRFDKRFWVYVLIVFFSGFLIEWAGVETGRIFGFFFYGNNLGYKLFDVPVIIGLNWLLFSYCSSVVAAKVFAKRPIRNAQFIIPLIASLLMVLIDIFLEQVAPVYDFWYWKGQQVPLQNYTAWFAFSFAFNYLFYKLEINTDNKIALWVYGVQLAFFAGLAFL